MKALKISWLILSLFFLSLPTQALVLGFSFDLYLSQLHAPDLSTQSGYIQLINLIWEQAQYLASARTYGLQFTYFSPSAWKTDKANFSLFPRALIARGNKSLSISQVQILSPSHFKIGVRYILTREETKRYRQLREKAITLPAKQGQCEYNHEATFFKEALEDSFYNAVHAYALERNLGHIEGLLLLQDNQPLLIKSGFAVQHSQVQLVIEKPETSSV